MKNTFEKALETLEFISEDLAKKVEISKAGPGKGLVAKKVLVHRNGKSFYQVYHVAPGSTADVESKVSDERVGIAIKEYHDNFDELSKHMKKLTNMSAHEVSKEHVDQLRDLTNKFIDSHLASKFPHLGTVVDTTNVELVNHTPKDSGIKRITEGDTPDYLPAGNWVAKSDFVITPGGGWRMTFKKGQYITTNATGGIRVSDDGMNWKDKFAATAGEPFKVNSYSNFPDRQKMWNAFADNVMKDESVSNAGSGEKPAASSVVGLTDSQIKKMDLRPEGFEFSKHVLTENSFDKIKKKIQKMYGGEPIGFWSLENEPGIVRITKPSKSGLKFIENAALVKTPKGEYMFGYTSNEKAKQFMDEVKGTKVETAEHKATAAKLDVKPEKLGKMINDDHKKEALSTLKEAAKSLKPGLNQSEYDNMDPVKRRTYKMAPDGTYKHITHPDHKKAAPAAEIKPEKQKSEKGGGKYSPGKIDEDFYVGVRGSRAVTSHKAALINLETSGWSETSYKSLSVPDGTNMGNVRFFTHPNSDKVLSLFINYGADASSNSFNLSVERGATKK